jgi:hypothetical protein
MGFLPCHCFSKLYFHPIFLAFIGKSIYTFLGGLPYFFGIVKECRVGDGRLQQQTGSAIMKRLLVASMALVFVWNLITINQTRSNGI